MKSFYCFVFRSPSFCTQLHRLHFVMLASHFAKNQSNVYHVDAVSKLIGRKIKSIHVTSFICVDNRHEFILFRVVNQSKGYWRFWTHTNIRLTCFFWIRKKTCLILFILFTDDIYFQNNHIDSVKCFYVHLSVNTGSDTSVSMKISFSSSFHDRRLS